MVRSLRIALPVLSVVAAVAAVALSGQQDSLPMVVAGIASGWLAGGGALAWSHRLGLAVTGLLAFCVAMYLGYHHVVPGEMVCSVSSVFDCGLVNSSKYAEIAGLPIGFIGAGFYLAVAALALGAGLRPDRFGGAPHIVLAGGLMGLGYTVFLMWATTQVGAWCLFCISLYGANALIALGGWRWSKETGVPLIQGLNTALTAKGDLATPTFGVVGVAVVLLAGSWAQKHEAPGHGTGEGGAAEEGLNVSLRLARAPALDGTEPLLGDPAAPYTIVEFADFQCPGCAAVAPDLHELVAKQPKVRVLFKYYPLSNLCNPNIGRLFHAQACAAAFGAECAREQGRFWEMNRLLFANYEVLDPEAIQFIASQVGLDVPSWQACLQKPETAAAITADIDAATAAGVEGTPSLFVKGLYGEDWVLMERGGPVEIGALIEAREKGTELPAPSRGGSSH